MKNNDLLVVSIVSIVAIFAMFFMANPISVIQDDLVGDANRVFISRERIDLTKYPLECNGIIENSLCHSHEGTLYGPIVSGLGNTNEDPLVINDLWITTTFPKEIELNEKFNFQMNVENPTTSPIILEYEILDLEDSVFYERISLNNFEDAVSVNSIMLSSCKFGSCYKLTINPGEVKTLEAIFKGIEPNFFSDHTSSHRLFLSFVLGNRMFGFWNLIKFDEGIQCGDYLFPKQYRASYDESGNDIILTPPFLGSEQIWINSVCKNNLFYPGADCANDLDCSKSEMCVQGICISRDNYRKYSFTGIGTEPIKAKGTKNILIFNIGDVEDNKCVVSQPENIKMGMDKIEEFYDSMSSKYLRANSDFINLNWNYVGQFNKDEFQGLNSAQIVEKVLNECNFNQENYEFVIVGNYDLLFDMGSNNWAMNEGAFLQRNLNDFDLYNSWTYTSIAHELAHLFGCSDRHTNLGGSYQWDRSLMGQRRFNKGCLESPDTYCNLDVCFAEMGWGDLNSDGIYDINERSRPSPIPIEANSLVIVD